MEYSSGYRNGIGTVIGPYYDLGTSGLSTMNVSFGDSERDTRVCIIVITSVEDWGSGANTNYGRQGSIYSSFLGLVGRVGLARRLTLRDTLASERRRSIWIASV